MVYTSFSWQRQSTTEVRVGISHYATTPLRPFPLPTKSLIPGSDGLDYALKLGIYLHRYRLSFFTRTGCTRLL